MFPSTPRRVLARSRLSFGVVVAIAVAIATAMTSGADAASRQPVAAMQGAFTSDRLSVQVSGSGPDVILIPGFASSRAVWRAEADRLEATHRVHRVQLSGFAGEPWVHGDGPFVEPMIADLARYIRETGLNKPAIIGHSMGGMSGIMLAQRYPDLVGKVMSVDSLPFFSVLFGPGVTVETARPFADQTAAQMTGADDAAFRQMQTASAVGLAIDPATRTAMVEWSMASDRRALASAIRDVMLTDLRPGLAAMTTPVWAVYAADANGGPPAALADGLWKQEYATLPGVTLIRVDDSRHFIMADQPQAFAGIVDRFLAAPRT